MVRYSIILMLFTIINFAQKLPFTENYSDDLSQWEIVDDQPAYSGPSNWFISAGILRQTSNIWAYAAPDEFKYHLGTHITAGNEKWDNYSFNVICRATDNDGIGIVFRYIDSRNYYRFLLMNDPNNGGPVRRLQKFINGEPHTLFEEITSEAIPQGWFSMTADARDDSLKVYLNGEVFARVKDYQFIEGKIGLSCYAMSGAFFDSVSVTEDFLVYGAPEQIEVYQDRSPYIQLPDTNSVMIAWRSKNKFKGRVEYGTSNETHPSVSEDSSVNKHTVVIDNLQSNTKYFYRVYNDNNQVNGIDSFTTVKSADVNEISFLIWGDSGTGSEAQYKIANLLSKETSDFAIHTGDVSQSDGSEYNDIYFKPYKELVNRMNIYTCIGNHDIYYDDAATYLNDFYLPSNNPSGTERYYSFSWGNAFFINMDSNIDYSSGSPQYEFLISQLESARKQEAEWTFISYHHPAYCELWDAWAGEQNVRDYLLPLFEKYSVDMVLNGHTHGYERGILNGIYYIISGGGGGAWLDVFYKGPGIPKQIIPPNVLTKN